MKHYDIGLARPAPDRVLRHRRQIGRCRDPAFTGFNHPDTRAEEIALQLGAEPAPELPRPSLVLKVNGAGATDDPDTIYEAARRAWSVRADLRSTPDLPIFVVPHDVVRAVYRAHSWVALDPADGKSQVVWEFDGVLDPELNANFTGKRLVPTDFGQLNWGQRGCHPLI